MKKINRPIINCITVLLTLVLLLGIAPQALAWFESENRLVIGDVNLNGYVDAGDSAIIMKHVVDRYDLNVYSRIAGDLNGDGEVNVGDSSLILRLVTGVDTLGVRYIDVVGDVLNPVNYYDIPYDNELLNNEFNYVPLCEYTSHAIYEPGDNTAYGMGYTVHLNEGETLVLEATALYDQMDTLLYLFDSAMNQLAFDDDSGDAYFSRITYTAEKQGDYRILVCGYDEYVIGEFNLYMSVKTALNIPDNPLDSNDNLNRSVEFTNLTFPENNVILQCGKAYSLKGSIQSDESILTIRVYIRNDATSSIELMAITKYSASSKVHTVSLNDGINSIDSQLRFADLSFGPKTLTVYCETDRSGEGVVFSGKFFMGATMALLDNNGIAKGSTAMTTEQKENMLDYLNSLDPTDLGSQAVINGFAHLGKRYGTGEGQLDCSSFVRAAYSKCGLQLPRIASEQGRTCYELNGELSVKELRPGDLIFFIDKACNSSGCSRYLQIHHVAMYVGTIDGVRHYIESSSSLGRVVLRFAWGETENDRWKIAFYSRPYELELQ